jgi:hypothetical protein
MTSLDRQWLFFLCCRDGSLFYALTSAASSFTRRSALHAEPVRSFPLVEMVQVAG